VVTLVKAAGKIFFPAAAKKWESFFRKVKALQVLAGLLLSLSFLIGCASTPQQNPICAPVIKGVDLGITSSPTNPWNGANLGRWFPGDFAVITFGCE
jgi:hypothetical protein